jgi:lantibiotic modifying enzyme
LHNVVVASKIRALLYANSIKELILLQKKYPSINLGAVIQSFIKELDTLHLPSYVNEVDLFRQDALHNFLSIEQIYCEKGARQWVSEYHTKYSFLHDISCKITKNTVFAIEEAIQRYNRITASSNNLFFTRSSLSAINCLSDADRHNHGRQVLLLHNEVGEKIVYKPTNGWSSHAMSRLINVCQLNTLEVCSLRTIPCEDEQGDFSFVEFVEHQHCQTKDDVQSFYSRLGHWLALCQAFSCSDVHCSNIIASCDRPFIIDSECHFQNYSRDEGNRFNSLLTNLIQTAPDQDAKEYWMPGICANARISYNPITPIVKNDDRIDVHFELGKLEITKTGNIPILNDYYVKPYQYKHILINGYKMAVEKIQSYGHILLKDSLFLTYLAKSKTRVILRATSAYYQIYRRLSMPDITTYDHAVKLIKSYQSRFLTTNSEWRQILHGDFPYFYTKLHSNKVVDIYGNTILEYPETLLQYLQTSINKLIEIPIEETLRKIDDCLQTAYQIETGETKIL